jgi:hypothetical protein
MIRRLGLVVLMAALVLPLGGCGRKAAPRAPENTIYPHPYPTYAFPGEPAAPAVVPEDENDTTEEPQAAPVTPEFRDLKHPDGTGTQGNTRP